MFLVGVRRMKEHREDKHSPYVIKRVQEASTLKSSLPYALTAPRSVPWRKCTGTWRADG